jgi:hypothetical protein
VNWHVDASLKQPKEGSRDFPQDSDHGRRRHLAALQVSRAAFDALSYAVRLTDCEPPENIEGPTAAAWAEINAHLGSMAKNLPEMIEQLGQHSFDHTPRVGDSFCGGGSIPFERPALAARRLVRI